MSDAQKSQSIHGQPLQVKTGSPVVVIRRGSGVEVWRGVVTRVQANTGHLYVTRDGTKKQYLFSRYGNAAGNGYSSATSDWQLVADAKHE